MGRPSKQIFKGAGFFSEHGDPPLDLLDGGEIVRG